MSLQVLKLVNYINILPLSSKCFIDLNFIRLNKTKQELDYIQNH